MKNLILALLIVSTVSLTASAQSQNIASDVAKLTLLHTYTHNFPVLSAVFKAEKQNGEPVYNLKGDQLKVVENGKACEVLGVKPVANAKPVHVGIVVDHSGSMEEDPSQLYDKNGKPLFTVDENENMIVPDDYTAPIDNAKTAVKAFVNSFRPGKDQLTVAGFGSDVDTRVALTGNFSRINNAVDGMKAEGKTALYDGIITGIEQLVANRNEIKVLVVLTDGQDNRSRSNPAQVIEFANQHEIPVYVIGLGEVNKGALEQIASQTGGEFFYTNTSTSLQSIYTTISKRVMTFYEVTYRSNAEAGSSVSMMLAAGKVSSTSSMVAMPSASPGAVASTVANEPTAARLSTVATTVATAVGGPVATVPVVASASADNSYLFIIAAIAVAAASASYAVYRKRSRVVAA